MVDNEMLRIEKLIEEREAYEISFFSMEPKLNVEVLDLSFNQYDELFAESFDYEEFDYSFDLEDNFEKSRDEKLIKERISYEIEYSRKINYDIVEMDFLDRVLESYEEPEIPEPEIPEYDYVIDEPHYFERYFDPLPVEEPAFRKPCNCWCDRDYMPHDDYDNSDCYYYPDGDLLGIYPL